MSDVYFNNNADRILEEFHEQIDVALETIGLAAEGYAKRLCAVDTGRLRNSVTYATSTKHSAGESPAKPPDYETHGTAEENSVYLGTNVEYAVYVELGTRLTPAQPFLKPAVADHADQYQKIVSKAMRGE